jgi:Bacteroides conjugative transposon TraM protein
MQTPNSSQLDRKRKFYTVLPLIIIPCLTLFFYALGGGKGEAKPLPRQDKGLNTLLPGAQLDSNSSEDKLALYQQALRDSAGLSDLRKADPYNRENNSTDSNETSVETISSGKTGTGYSDPNEQKVNRRLAALQQALTQPEVSPVNSYSIENEQLKTRLEAMQQQIREMGNNTENRSDPQMEQINGVLAKILDIQHPETVRTKLEQESVKNRGQVYPVAAREENALSELLDTGTNSSPSTGFYGLSENMDTGYPGSMTVTAVVNETQELTNGATIKLRLSGDIMVNGLIIPKGNFVFGTCAIEGERLKVTISSIRNGTLLFPVSLTVVDMDGLEGIKIPGAISRDVTKESVDQGIQGLSLMTLDPSIGAQAAGAAVQTAKNLLSRKVKLIKAVVKAGYPVLLVDKNKQLR